MKRRFCATSVTTVIFTLFFVEPSSAARFTGSASVTIIPSAATASVLTPAPTSVLLNKKERSFAAGSYSANNIIGDNNYQISIENITGKQKIRPKISNLLNFKDNDRFSLDIELLPQQLNKAVLTQGFDIMVNYE